MGLPNLNDILCVQLYVKIHLFKAFWQFFLHFLAGTEWQTNHPIPLYLEAPGLEV